MSKQFEAHGIRFIYAALPCKKAVYPGLILPRELLKKHPDIYYDGHPNIIPQWRRMLYELINCGVEVIDLYPYFSAYSDDNRLFSYGHDISCAGATLTGNVIGTYLSDTAADIEPLCVPDDFTGVELNVDEENVVQLTERILYKKKTYTGTETISEIGIFGNCNLQKYGDLGIDITSQIANTMSYPVNNLGRFLPFNNAANSPFTAPEGIFRNKKIVIYLGFPSAAFVRSLTVNGLWATDLFKENCF